MAALAGDIMLCSWARHFTLTVPLSTQVYKWVPVNCWGKPNKLRSRVLGRTDVRVWHPNADSYRELSPKQIFQLNENEKKRQYSRLVLEVEQGTFTPLVFTSTGGMADKCKR